LEAIVIHEYNGKLPDTSLAAFIAWNAEINGDVTLGEESSIWYGSTLRGDIEPIIVGKGSNIQDNSVLHTRKGAATIVGDYVTGGHGIILHSCTIGHCCLIGMGAIVLNRAEIGDESIVGAGSLVTEGKKFPPRSVIVGSPARVVRSVTDEEIAEIRATAERYIKKANEHSVI
jgi:carbonic anhydrase/acetyltransferase-like protein (isoleucine patch superfamily)